MLRNLFKREKAQRVKLGAISNAFGVAISMATNFLSVPLTVSYLGDERFGLWMAISTFMSVLIFLDFGFPIYLQNKITRTIANEQITSCTHLISDGFLYALYLTLAMAIISGLLIVFIDFGTLFNVVDFQAINEITPSLGAMILVLSGSVFLNVVQRIYFAHQETHVISIISVFFKLVGLAMLFYGVKHHVGLPGLILTVGFIPNFFTSAVCVYILPRVSGYYQFGSLSWKFSSDTLSDKNKSTASLVIFFASIGYFLISNFIVYAGTLKYGAASIVDYSIFNKVQGAIVMVALAILNPIWPAIAEAYSKSDYFWILRCIKICIAILILLSIGISLSFYYLLPSFFKVWLRSEVVIPNSYYIPMMIMTIIIVWNSALSTFLNGMSRFKVQSAITISLVGVLFISVDHVPDDFGVIGVIWMVSFAFLLRGLVFGYEVYYGLSLIRKY